MLGKRAALVTFYTLRTVPKVCRSSNSLYSFKGFSFLRNLSTATERSDFDFVNALNSGYSRNSNGDCGQGRNSDAMGNSGQSQGSSGRGYGEKGVQDQQNNFGVCGKSHGSKNQQSPAEENRMFDDNSSFSKFRKGFQQNGDWTIGYIREGHGGEFQQSQAGNKSNSENLAGHPNGLRQSPDAQYGGLASKYTEGHRGEFQGRENPHLGRSFENFDGSSNGSQQIPERQKDSCTHFHTGLGHRNDFQPGQGWNNTNFGWGVQESMQQHPGADVQNSKTWQQNGKNPLAFNTVGPLKPQPGFNGRSYEQSGTESTVGYYGRTATGPLQNANGFQQIPEKQKDTSTHLHTSQGRRNDLQPGLGGQNTNFGWGIQGSMQRHPSADVQNSKTWQQSGKNPLGFNTVGPVKPQPSFRGRSYEQSGTESTVGYYGRTVTGPNSNWYNEGNVGVPHQNPQYYSAASTQNFQQPQVNYGISAGVSQQQYDVRNIGISDQNLQNYSARNARNFQQSQVQYNEVNAGIHQLSNAIIKQNDATTEDGDNAKLSGTIEELDHFLKEGKLEEVVQVLGLLEKQGIPVDLSRYLSSMKMCSEDKALEEARSIHKYLMRSISDLEVTTYNKILEMYSECGSMEDAFSVFDNMPRDLTSWNIMITALVKNGVAEAAIQLFEEFKHLGLKPDGQMYLGVFCACGALCDTAEGMLHFESMAKDHGIVPSMEHYAGVVNMLGSAGHLGEALEFIEKMPIEPSLEVWETLMNVSRIQGNLDLGDRCAELIELLDPSRLNEQSRAGFIPLKASDLAKGKGKKKVNGQSPLEIRSRVHEYRAGDRSHPDHEKLYALLWSLKHQMKEAGYIPETKFVLHDVDQESKEEALLSHSERLAVAKGLLNTPARTTMRVIKNLRVCGDCHNAMKIISKLVGRELIMRDAKRFHHFKDGICSCRDYW